MLYTSHEAIVKKTDFITHFLCVLCMCQVSDLKGGEAALNAQILRDVFGGQQGAVADALCLNAGVALAAAQVAPTAQDGIRMAQARTCLISICDDRHNYIRRSMLCVRRTQKALLLHVDTPCLGHHVQLCIVAVCSCQSCSLSM